MRAAPVHKHEYYPNHEEGHAHDPHDKHSQTENCLCIEEQRRHPDHYPQCDDIAGGGEATSFVFVSSNNLLSLLRRKRRRGLHLIPL